MRYYFFFLILVFHSALFAQINILENVVKIANDKSSLSNQEVSKGLKQALEIGAQLACNKASNKDGFYKNELIKISFPQELNQMKKTLIKVGFSSKIKEFELSLNRAAEDASTMAINILIDQIIKVKLNEVLEILNGKDDAATQYLKKNTYSSLYDSFFPIVNKSIDKAGVSKYWNTLSSRYNKIPLVKDVDTDLNKYVTEKALNGLFKLIAVEESKIRGNVEFRTTELLQKVFQ